MHLLREVLREAEQHAKVIFQFSFWEKIEGAEKGWGESGQTTTPSLMVSKAEKEGRLMEAS